MLKGSQVCPKCNSNKFMIGSHGVSWKVLHHFPLISRLLQMYRCKTLANLLIWNKCGGSSNGLVQSVLDSKSWKHVDEKWSEIASEPWNIRHNKPCMVALTCPQPNIPNHMPMFWPTTILSQPHSLHLLLDRYHILNKLHLLQETALKMQCSEVLTFLSRDLW